MATLFWHRPSKNLFKAPRLFKLKLCSKLSQNTSVALNILLGIDQMIASKIHTIIIEFISRYTTIISYYHHHQIREILM
ncbi:uncharacterized protein OCT59_019160 [Rhizophagus irregularis]|uniref:uncharacterized protein n=1 Tax=Rhizophagus irregularis TaxID=588596 RepID=UPI003332B07D|nr:hypothetical protein OCT59_019160 [Rhizophagus irregularis]